MRRRRLVKLSSYEFERKQKVASDELGFVWEREGVEVVDGEREENRGGYDGGETAEAEIGE